MESTVKVSSKNQISLPAWARKQIGVVQGRSLRVSVKDGAIRLEPTLDIEAIAQRTTQWAKDIAPITDVDAYYQEHRTR